MKNKIFLLSLLILIMGVLSIINVEATALSTLKIYTIGNYSNHTGTIILSATTDDIANISWYYSTVSTGPWTLIGSNNSNADTPIMLNKNLSWSTAGISDACNLYFNVTATNETGAVLIHGTVKNVAIVNTGTTLTLSGKTPANGANLFRSDGIVYFDYTPSAGTSCINTCSFYVDSSLTSTHTSITSNALDTFNKNYTANAQNVKWYVSCSDRLSNTVQTSSRIYNLDRAGGEQYTPSPTPGTVTQPTEGKSTWWVWLIVIIVVILLFKRLKKKR